MAKTFAASHAKSGTKRGGKAKEAAAPAGEKGKSKGKEKGNGKGEPVPMYPPGRYECAACGLSVLVSEPTEQLPECVDCGSTEFVGEAPRLMEPVAEAKDATDAEVAKRYPAGLYTCTACGVVTVVIEDSDQPSECEYCGRQSLKLGR
jgi:DNA-directed RNA polymerase subunit RPC12/RpoP